MPKKKIKVNPAACSEDDVWGTTHKCEVTVGNVSRNNMGDVIYSLLVTDPANLESPITLEIIAEPNGKVEASAFTDPGDLDDFYWELENPSPITDESTLEEVEIEVEEPYKKT